MLASKGDTKMSGRRVKSSGWAAFDLQQRQKNGLEARPSDEPFPSLPSSVTSLQPSETYLRNNHLPVKPFSSVILPSVDFPAPVDDRKNNNPSEIGISGGPQSNEISWERSYPSVFKQLKELYSSVDDSLINDIMAAVDNDFDKASSFLKTMVSNESSEDPKDAEVVKSRSNSTELICDEKTSCAKGGVSVGKTTESAKFCCALEAGVGNDNESRNEFELCDNCTEIDATLGPTDVPVEPEWEGDDVYFTHRKEAIKLMRAATRHSKAATNSFLRGDHYFAHQFSLKAQQEWAVAQRLNAQAAREILSIRNENNGLWRLDLHGLHAEEAVQALQERLHMIETQVSFKGSGPSGLTNGVRTKPEALHASSSHSSNNIEKSDDQAFFRQRPIWLEVITGIGNHSRGGAALPTAVRNFVANNGYRYDEARPGVVMVRPKFRF